MYRDHAARQRSRRPLRSRSRTAGCSECEAPTGSRARGRARDQPRGRWRPPTGRSSSVGSWSPTEDTAPSVAAVPPVRIKRIARYRPAFTICEAAIPILGFCLRSPSSVASTRRTSSTASRPSCPSSSRWRKRSFLADEVGGDVAITGGALDAIERSPSDRAQGGRPGRGRGSQLASDCRSRPCTRVRGRAGRDRPRRPRSGQARRRAAPRSTRRRRARPEPDRRSCRRCSRPRATLSACEPSRRTRHRRRLRRTGGRRAVCPAARPPTVAGCSSARCRRSSAPISASRSSPAIR